MVMSHLSLVLAETHHDLSMLRDDALLAASLPSADVVIEIELTSVTAPHHRKLVEAC
jgi:hypothetical protein